MEKTSLDSFGSRQLECLLQEYGQQYQRRQLQKQLCQALLGPPTQWPNTKRTGEKVAEAEHRFAEQQTRLMVKTELEQESNTYAKELACCSDTEKLWNEVAEVEKKMEDYKRKLIHYESVFPIGHFVSRLKFSDTLAQKITEMDKLLQVQNEELYSQSKELQTIRSRLKTELGSMVDASKDDKTSNVTNCVGIVNERQPVQLHSNELFNGSRASIIKKSSYRPTDRALSIEFRYPSPDAEYAMFPQLKLTLYFRNTNRGEQLRQLDHAEVNKDALYMTPVVNNMLKTSNKGLLCRRVYKMWLHQLRIRKELEVVGQKYVIDFKPRTGKLSVVVGSKGGLTAASLDIICILLVESSCYSECSDIFSLVKITYGDSEINHEDLLPIGSSGSLCDWLDEIKDIVLKKATV